jgi:hypothetical protein
MLFNVMDGELVMVPDGARKKTLTVEEKIRAGMRIVHHERCKFFNYVWVNAKDFSEEVSQVSESFATKDGVVEHTITVLPMANMIRTHFWFTNSKKYIFEIHEGQNQQEENGELTNAG